MKLGSQRRRGGGFSKAVKEQRSRFYIISRCVVMLLLAWLMRSSSFVRAVRNNFGSRSILPCSSFSACFASYQNGTGNCTDTDPCSTCPDRINWIWADLFLAFALCRSLSRSVNGGYSSVQNYFFDEQIVHNQGYWNGRMAFPMNYLSLPLSIFSPQENSLSTLGRKGRR